MKNKPSGSGTVLSFWIDFVIMMFNPANRALFPQEQGGKPHNWTVPFRTKLILVDRMWKKLHSNRLAMYQS
ncbi:MAG: hypothetical protein ABIJ65_06545 [Chloroflexota bacterium]